MQNVSAHPVYLISNCFSTGLELQTQNFNNRWFAFNFNRFKRTRTSKHWIFKTFKIRIKLRRDILHSVAILLASGVIFLPNLVVVNSGEHEGNNFVSTKQNAWACPIDVDFGSGNNIGKGITREFKIPFAQFSLLWWDLASSRIKQRRWF